MNPPKISDEPFCITTRSSPVSSMPSRVLSWMRRDSAISARAPPADGPVPGLRRAADGDPEAEDRQAGADRPPLEIAQCEPDEVHDAPRGSIDRAVVARLVS